MDFSIREHLRFMGIEIDGPMDAFVEKLEAKGFTVIEKHEDSIVMDGTFTNKPVHLLIFQTSITKRVYKIGIFYKENNSWYSIKSDYNNLKDAYKNKYTLEQDYHFFLDPYYEGDDYEIQAVELDKCRYFSVFKAQHGSISLNITTLKKILVSYEDSINSELAEQESNSALQEEI